MLVRATGNLKQPVPPQPQSRAGRRELMMLVLGSLDFTQSRTYTTTVGMSSPLSQRSENSPPWSGSEARLLGDLRSCQVDSGYQPSPPGRYRRKALGMMSPRLPVRPPLYSASDNVCGSAWRKLCPKVILTPMYVPFQPEVCTSLVHVFHI